MTTLNKQTNNKKVIGLDSWTKHVLIRLMKPFANEFILLNPRNRARKNRVNLNYWAGKPNLGDAISPVIVEYMLAKKELSLATPVSETSHLYAVGSVITAGLQDATVWGSGVLYSLLGYRLRNRKLDIRAVRGPLTGVVLLEYGYDVPAVYGDPAIFLPQVYTPPTGEKQYKYGIIAHKNGSSRLNHVEALSADSYRLIDIKTEDYKSFVDQLCSVEKVISTSLHGIILAEAYGIPAVLVRPEFSLFKYYDWYLATGRAEFPILDSLEDVTDDIFPEVPDLRKMRKRLEEAFPYDLFFR